MPKFLPVKVTMPPFFTQVFGLAYVIWGCVVVFVGMVIDCCSGSFTFGPSGDGLKVAGADNADVLLIKNITAVIQGVILFMFINMIGFLLLCY